jgi:class 3 adenylate cyclase
MTGGQFVRLLLVAEALVVLDNLVTLRRAYRLLEPASAWLAGNRAPERTVAAWRALAGLPSDFIRATKVQPLVFNALPFSIYATVELGLPAYSVLIILAGGAVLVLYGLIVRFFAMELTMRPVLEDVASHLPADVELAAAGLPLRWKLLAGLPAINIITGVVVSGLATTGDNARLSDLGVAVLVAVLVAFTASLELTLLLSRSIFVPIQDLRAATERVARGDLSVRVPVLGTDETGRLTHAFNQMVSGLAERERLHEAFGAFVSPDLADRVAQEGTVLEGEELEVSVLFLDIRGFTGFAERSSAREVVAHLNRFYELVVPVLTRHGGHADKFVGDGLLAVFGAPERIPDHADRALDAALEIVEVVEATYGDSLKIGVGVNSGHVVAGTIGGGGRVEFTVIGDAVNTANRVEAATRLTGDTILLTESTRALLGRPRAFVERPAVALKGKRERVRLYAPAAVVGGSVAGEAAAPAAASDGDGLRITARRGDEARDGRATATGSG